MQHLSTSLKLAAATAGLFLLNAAPGHTQTVYGLQTSATATSLPGHVSGHDSGHAHGHDGHHRPGGPAKRW
ncbi:hypothetical protein [Hymenobacter siberiensis]|jgi:hypothetical protein|uniref:hypothetical protein n=1 Tax=Hymenobacter siberiensis TaxID=2848396 RepID=UPI001D035BD3|nr:hypothetical protein [Hymenobacter siberiensis]